VIALGVRPGVTREEYDALDRVNISTLKWMGRSPAHYNHHKKNKDEGDTDAKKLGRARHMAVFEPERFLASVAVWKEGIRRGGKWDEFKAANEGRELLTKGELDECRAIQDAVHKDPIAKEYLRRGQSEVTILWETGPFACKGRIDYDCPEAIVDLKTTVDASIEGFGRQAHKLHMIPQAAWYSDGYEKACGVRKPYVLIAVENEAPHVVQVYEVHDTQIEKGRDAYLGWLDKLGYCQKHDWWPGYSAQVLDLALPKWAEKTE
jgi:hypothetical protein